MKVINKKLGNDFEQELCEIFADAGYWVHNFANRKKVVKGIWSVNIEDIKESD